MNILITNDDGIQAEGLQVLVKHLSKKNKVFVLAPDSNRSAVSNHLTMFSPCTLIKFSENQWGCSGFPADCSFHGIHSGIFEEKIDVVVSGINKGYNMGTDIVYSGTCAAARQAVLDGVPAIAVSIEPDSWEESKKTGLKYDAIAEFVEKNLEKLKTLSSTSEPRTFTNVNGASVDSYEGVQIVNRLCIRNYGDSAKLTDENENTKISSYIMGFHSVGNTYHPQSDASFAKKHFVVVSSVYVDPMCAKIVDDIDFKL